MKLKRKKIKVFSGLHVLFALLFCAFALTGCSSGDTRAQGASEVFGQAQPAATAPPKKTEPSKAETKKTGAFNAAKEISVISREEGSGTRGAFIELFGIEVKQDGVKKDMTTKEADIVSKTDVMLLSVADNPASIGYVSIGSLNDTVKALAVDGAAATSGNVKNGSYKISRPFMIATKPGVTDAAQDFINYILSSEGQAAVSAGYVKVDDNAPAFVSNGASGKVVVAGSSSVSPLMEKLIEAYALLNAGVTLELQTSDSTAGMTAAIDGNCDIGMASRALSEKESQILTPTQIAIDGIAVIVNKENPLDDIAKDTVKNIYVGDTVKWNEIIK